MYRSLGSSSRAKQLASDTGSFSDFMLNPFEEIRWRILGGAKTRLREVPGMPRPSRHSSQPRPDTPEEPRGWRKGTLTHRCFTLLKGCLGWGLIQIH